MILRPITTVLIFACVAISSAYAQSGSRSSAPRRSAQPSPPPIAQPLSQPSLSQPSLSQPSTSQPLSSQDALPSSPIAADTTTDGAATSSSTTSSSTGSSSLGIPAAEVNDSIWEINDPASNYFVDHSFLDCFLARYVITDSRGLNRVHYRRVSQTDKCELKRYLKYLQSIDVRTLNRDTQLVYWINLYNARVVSLILDHYRIQSVRQIKTNLLDLVGPFDDELLVVLGKPLTLNDVESGIIRPIWNDPRAHYALNCASYGCPNLRRQAWHVGNLEADLNSAAYRFLNSDRALRVGLFGRVKVTKIFKWYADDFGGSDQAILQHIRRYASPATCRKLKNVDSISGYFYDWSLNDASKVRGPLLERLIR